MPSSVGQEPPLRTGEVARRSMRRDGRVFPPKLLPNYEQTCYTESPRSAVLPPDGGLTMKGMRKTLLAVTVAALLLTSFGGAYADSATVSVSGIELPVGSFSELTAQVPDVPLMDAPKGATDVAYSIVGDSPTVAQMRFVLHDRTFTYRAARFGTSASMPDISGMTNAFDAQMELGGVLYRVDSTSGAGVASWYFESTHSQYCVTIAKGYDAEYLRQVAVALRSQTGMKPVPAPTPVPGPYEGHKTGTVSAVTATRLTILSDGAKYVFGIDASTVSPYGARVRKGAYVRVAYAAPYEPLCLASYIELIEPAPTAKPTRAPSSATKSGTILERCGDTLRILRPSGSVYTFYTGYAALYGDLSAGVGDTAKVSYYVDIDGTKTATKVTFSVVYYNPCGDVVPCPIPNPCPVPYPCPTPYNPPCPLPYTGGYNPQIPDGGAVLDPYRPVCY